MLRENYGTYLESFVLSGLLCLLAAALSMLIGRTHTGGAPAVAPAA
jgi:hypothetical protein